MCYVLIVRATISHLIAWIGVGFVDERVFVTLGKRHGGTRCKVCFFVFVLFILFCDLKEVTLKLVWTRLYLILDGTTVLLRDTKKIHTLSKIDLI